MQQICVHQCRNLTVLDSHTTRMPCRHTWKRRLRNPAGSRLRTRIWLRHMRIHPPKERLGRPVTLGAFICGFYVCNLTGVKYFKSKHNQYLIEKIQPQDVKTEQPQPPRGLSGAVSCRRTRSL